MTLDEALAQTDSTQFVAMVRSAPFQAFLAGVKAEKDRSVERLIQASEWQETNWLQGKIKAFHAIADICSQIEMELKKREKEG